MSETLADARGNQQVEAASCGVAMVRDTQPEWSSSSKDDDCPRHCLHLASNRLGAVSNGKDMVMYNIWDEPECKGQGICDSFAHTVYFSHDAIFDCSPAILALPPRTFDPCMYSYHELAYMHGLDEAHYPVPANIGRVSIGEHYPGVVFIDSADADDPVMVYCYDTWTQRNCAECDVNTRE